MAEITLAKKAGFCFGVDRAIKLIEKLASEGRKVATLGPIIHNSQVIEDLESRGVRVVNLPSEVEDGAILVLRTHGVTQDVLREVEESGCGRAVDGGNRAGLYVGSECCEDQRFPAGSGTRKKNCRCPKRRNSPL